MNKMIFMFLILTQSIAFAIAPEGFEVFALRGKKDTDVSIKYAYTDTLWDLGYQSTQIFVSIPTKSDNFWTLGGYVQTTKPWMGRDAYFARFDLVFLDTNSLSFKWMHDDYKEAKAGADTLSFEFNTMIGTKNGVFSSIGYYHKWTKHQWDKNWRMPFDINTDDERGFLSAQLGWKTTFGQKNFWTFDLNLRDPFGYHMTDFLGLDFTLNFLTQKKSAFQILIGYRYSGLWVGTADLAQFHSSLGYSF